MLQEDMSFITTLLISLSLAPGIYAGVAGQLNVISQNESIELYDLTASGEVSRIFAARLELDLRPPCPSCHPSYNLVFFNDLIILPSSEVLSVFTNLSKAPYVYTQSIEIPDCSPLSLIASSQTPDLIFLDCEDLTNDGNYFLAELQHTSDGTGHQWTYQKMSGFETLDRAGAYVEVSAINSVMMLYVHEQYEYIQMNGFRSGYITHVPRPTGCVHVVRITATGKTDVMLLECSASNVSELVTSLYILESAKDTHILDTGPYSICPIRFTEDRNVAAIFTEHYILVTDLVSGIFTNISVNQAIYDGIITRFDSNSFYVVYSTSIGLHQVYLTKHNQGSGQSFVLNRRLLFDDTHTVCAVQGCSLLTLIDSDTLLVALDLKIVVFSISSLHKVANVGTKYQPSRNFFQKRNTSTTSPAIPSGDVHLMSPTPTEATGHSKTDQTEAKPTIPPPKETSKPNDKHAIDGRRKGKNGVVIAVPSAVVVVVVCSVLLLVLLLVYIFKIRRRCGLHERYKCISKESLISQSVFDDQRQRQDKPEREDDMEEVEVEVGVEKCETRVAVTLEGDAEREEEVEIGSRRRGGGEREEEEGKEKGEEEGKERGLEWEGRQEEPESNVSTPTGSGTSTAVYLKIDVEAQQVSLNGRFDGSQQVIGSLSKETPDIRDSPDGCTSSL